MVALYCDARSFFAHPVCPAIRTARTHAAEVRVNDCTVLYLALESGDTLSGAGEALRAALERRGRLVSPKIVLHSFNHLTGHAMAVAQAQDLYEKLPVFLESHGSAAAVLTEFGWIYEICLHDIGQRGSKGRIVTQGGTENEKG